MIDASEPLISIPGLRVLEPFSVLSVFLFKIRGSLFSASSAPARHFAGWASAVGSDLRLGPN